MKLINFLLAFNVLIFLNSIELLSQDIDEIINKHVIAHGGEENWDKIKTLKITGSLTGFSTVKNFTTVHCQPNLYRSDFGLGKFNVTLAYNGEYGWTIDPWFDVSFPRMLNSSEENVVVQKAEMCSPFLNYKQKGYKVELLGKDQLEGVEVFKLKLTRQNNKVENWYLNAETYLEFKQESTWDDFGHSTPQETFFDDFRAVDDIIIPFNIERSFLIRNRITEILKVEINPLIPDDYFQMPLSIEMEKLKFMEGKWSVKLKKQGRKGWRVIDSITTQISLKHNLVQMKLNYENYFKHINQINISYNNDSANYILSTYNSFSSKMDFYEGIVENDTLELRNAGFQKYLIISNLNNGFIIESQTSADKGKNWRVSEKFVFSRFKN